VDVIPHVVSPLQQYPRWDKGDRVAYYGYTRDNLVPLISELDLMISDGDYCIDNVYNRIVSVLIHGEKQFIPRRSKNFYKYW